METINNQEIVKNIKKITNTEEIHDLKKEDIHNLALHAAKEGNPLYPVPRIFKLKEFEEICQGSSRTA